MKPELLREQYEGITAYDLDQKHFEPVKWAVPEIIPEGVTLAAGRPKTGKSWLLLDIAIAVAAGGLALGKFQCVQGKVLYCANEDNERRLKKRGRVLLPDGNMPKNLFYWTNNKLKRLNEGGIKQLREWLNQNRDARLIIIDTLASVKPIKKGGEQFLNDYEVGSELTKIAHDYSIAVVVIHHTRKAESDEAVDDISGTLGLVAGFDGYMNLKRTPQKECDGILVIDGRDIENGGEFALSWDQQRAQWSLLGDAQDFNTTTERKLIKDAIFDNGSAMDAYSLAEKLNKNRPAVSKTCERMIQDGELFKTKKEDSRKIFYTIANPGGT